MTQYEKDYKDSYGKNLILKVIGTNLFFESWGYPNSFSTDWMLALQYKNNRTAKNAVKKLEQIHSEKKFAIVEVNNYI